MKNLDVVKEVPLAEIRDIGWPTEAKKVEKFRELIRKGTTLIPRLALIWHNDDMTWHYEIIDGLHRYEALKLEHQETTLCQIEEYRHNEYPDVRLHRIQACNGQVDEVLNARVTLDLRDWFITDMIHIVKGDTGILEPYYGEDGAIHEKQRQVPLPDDPLQALDAIDDHCFCISSISHRKPQNWIAKVDDWFTQRAKQLGISSRELRDRIGVAELIQDGFKKDTPTRTARLLHEIRDNDLRQLIHRRLLKEVKVSRTPTNLEYALDWLGCGPGTDTTPTCRRRSKSDMISMLQHNTLIQLFNQYVEAQRTYMESKSPKSPAQKPTPPKSEETFNPFFDGTPANVIQYTQRTLPMPPVMPNAETEGQHDYETFHSIVVTLQTEVERLTELHGDKWRQWEKVQEDMQWLRDMSDGEYKVING